MKAITEENLGVLRYVLEAGAALARHGVVVNIKLCPFAGPEVMIGCLVAGHYNVETFSDYEHDEFGDTMSFSDVKLRLEELLHDYRDNAVSSDTTRRADD
ncbi:MAG: hypothetical protein ACOX83_10745 [Candidatus Spyradocola sp.]|jgi:hypothetical protein